MTETKRTAAQIRTYCEAATGGALVAEPWDRRLPNGLWCVTTPGKVHVVTALSSSSAEPDARFFVNARTDLPRVLMAAVWLRGALESVSTFLLVHGMNDHLAILAETAWLELSPDPPPSPDGESGESET